MKVTPRHNKFLDKMIDSEIFVIATVRGKDDYVLEEVNGKQIPRKVALGYDQRKDTEYLFTCAFNIDQETHIANAVKDNTHIFENKNEVLSKKDGVKIFEWASGGDLDQKIKDVQDSIEEGKRRQAENEKQEAEEINKGRGKSKPKAEDSVIESKEINEVENALQELESVASPSELLELIRAEFSRLQKGKMKQSEILDIMDDAGCRMPKKDTDPELLQTVLSVLRNK